MIEYIFEKPEVHRGIKPVYNSGFGRIINTLKDTAV